MAHAVAVMRLSLRQKPTSQSSPSYSLLRHIKPSAPRNAAQWQSYRFNQQLAGPQQQVAGANVTAAAPGAATISPPPRPVPQPNKLIRRGFFALGLAIAFSTGWMLATNTTVMTAVAVATQPSDEQTLELWQPDPNSPTGKIEAQLQQLALVRQLNAEMGDAANNNNNKKWQASRPHLKIPASMRPANFTGGHLLQEDKLTVPPLVYVDGAGKELVSIIYLGNKVCGHPGLVHGGLLATLMDEGLARTCFAQLPNKVGVTANLQINYRAPCRAGQFVVLKGETIKVEGRKAWVKGRIETITPDGSPGKVLVDGEALYIEPKGYATKLMRITQ